jgi:hypothetical protein
MDKKSNHQTTVATPWRGAGRLKNDGAMSAAEARQFIEHLRGKNPHEVMGVVAQSSLAQGIFQATVGTIVLMAALTAGPYFMGEAAHHAKPATPPANEQASAAATAEEPAAGPSTAAVPGAPEGTSKKALERMGVDEVKQSDPGKNPLDSKVDDLFDAVK